MKTIFLNGKVIKKIKGKNGDSIALRCTYKTLNSQTNKYEDTMLFVNASYSPNMANNIDRVAKPDSYVEVVGRISSFDIYPRKDGNGYGISLNMYINQIEETGFNRLLKVRVTDALIFGKLENSKNGGKHVNSAFNLTNSQNYARLFFPSKLDYQVDKMKLDDKSVISYYGNLAPSIYTDNDGKVSISYFIVIDEFSFSTKKKGGKDKDTEEKEKAPSVGGHEVYNGKSNKQQPTQPQPVQSQQSVQQQPPSRETSNNSLTPEQQSEIDTLVSENGTKLSDIPQVPYGSCGISDKREVIF